MVDSLSPKRASGHLGRRWKLLFDFPYSLHYTSIITNRHDIYCAQCTAITGSRSQVCPFVSSDMLLTLSFPAIPDFQVPSFLSSTSQVLSSPLTHTTALSHHRSTNLPCAIALSLTQAVASF